MGIVENSESVDYEPVHYVSLSTVESVSDYQLSTPVEGSNSGWTIAAMMTSILALVGCALCVGTR